MSFPEARDRLLAKVKEDNNIIQNTEKRIKEVRKMMENYEKQIKEMGSENEVSLDLISCFLKQYLGK